MKKYFFMMSLIFSKEIKKNNQNKQWHINRDYFRCFSDTVWTDMKWIHRIQYQQHNKWLCLPFGLSSALFYLKQYNLSKALSELAKHIEKQDINRQCEAIVDTYNFTFNKYKNYGLGK